MKVVTNYLENVTKSIMYAAADIGKNDMMPNVGEFASANKDFLKLTYTMLKNPKAAIKKSVATIQSSKIYQALDYGAKNAFEDLRTGNFYNKEREDRDSVKLAFGEGAENWDDLSEFGIDDDWESSISKNSKKDEVTTGDLKIINAIEGSNAAGAAATVNAVIKSSEYQVNAARVSSANMYMQNERLFGGLHKDLSVIGATMDSIHKMTSASLQNLDKNTSDFFTAELKLSQERNAMLKEILEMQRSMYTSANDKEKAEKDKEKSKYKKNRWYDVQFNGIADIDSYFEVIKRNMDNTLSSVLPSFGGEDSNMLATFMMSPFKGLMTAMVKGVIPATVKAASKELDNTISGIFGHIMARLSNSKNRDNGIFSFISKIFGINTSVNSNIDTSRYEKGPIPFDGITRKAIADVIPSYLRRIESYITGKPEQTFNYQTGRWVTMQSIKINYENIRKNAVKSANSNLREMMDPAIKRVKATNAYDDESINKAYEEFQQYMYDYNGIFNPRASAEKNNVSAHKYPNFYKHYNLIRTIYTNADYTEVQTRGGMKKFHSKYSTKINMSKDVLDAKDSEERKYRDLETAIGGITQVASALGVDTNGKWVSNKFDKNNKKFTIKESILYTKDDIGNTIFDYLKNINQELTWWRQNGYEDLYDMVSSNSIPTIRGRRNRGSQYRNNPNDLTHREYVENRKNNNKRRFNEINLEHRDHKAERERYQQQLSRYSDDIKQKAIKAITSGEAIDLEYLSDENEGGAYINALLGLIAEGNSIAYVNELGGYNTDLAGYIDKHYIKTGAKSLKDIRDIVKKEEAEKEKEDKEEKQKTFIDTLIGKVKETGTLTGGIVGATGEVISNLLMTADKAIYEIMYKAEIEDEAHEKYQGFMDMMQHKITNTFDNIKKYAKDNIADPFKKWLGIDKDGEITKRFTGELKNMGKGIWETFVQANKDVWSPIGNQLLADIGLRQGAQTSAEKERAKDRKKYSKDVDDINALTSIYNRNFIRLMAEYGLNYIEYGNDFERAKSDLEKKVKEYYIKATNDMKEVSSREEANKALNYAESLDDKKLEEIAKNLNIDIENKTRTEILDAITNYTKTDKEFNSTLSRNAAIESGLDATTGDVINNATKASVKEKSRYNQNRETTNTINGEELINPEVSRGTIAATGMRYRLTNNEYGDQELVAEELSEKAVKRAIAQQNKRNARKHRYSVDPNVAGRVIDHGEMGPGKNKLNALKRNIIQKQKIRDGVDEEEGAEYKQKGSRDIRYWALKVASVEERSSYCISNGFYGSIEDKEKILIGLGVPKEQIVATSKAIDQDDALNKIWLRYNTSMYAKGTDGAFVTGDAILSKGEIALRKSVDGLFEATKVPKTGLYNLGSANDGGTAILRDSNSGTTERGDLDRERLYAKKNGLKVQNFAEATSDITINGDKLTAEDVLSEAKKNIPEAAAGGLVGSVLSMVLGLAGGPIVGAAMGAGASIIRNSTNLKEKLFGKVDKDGKRDGSGFVSKTIVDAAQKYAPDMFKYGLAGIIPGLLTPLGPIGGLLAGSAIGMLKNNEKFTDKYFGEDGKLTLKSKEKEIIKKLIPGTAKGAAAGIIATMFGGPFGLLGNATLGAAIGMMTSTDAFKDSLFGKEMKDGTRDGGLLNAIKEAFEPIIEAGREFKDKLLNVIDNNIVRPISDFVTPFIHELPRIAAWLPNKINDFFENHFGRSLTGIFKDFLGKPTSWLISKVITPVTSGLLNVATSPMKLLGAAGNSMRRSQIRNRQADYMTAKERLEWGQEHGLGNGSAFDQALADIGSGKEGSMSLKTAKDLKEAIAIYGDTEASLAVSKKKTEKDINNVLDSFNVNGSSLSSETKSKVREYLSKGNVKKAKEYIAKHGLDGSDTGLTEKQYDQLFGADGQGLDKLFSDYSDIQNRRKKLKNISIEDKEDARVKVEKHLQEMGIFGEQDRNGFIKSILTDPKQREKLLRNLDTEIADREANKEEKSTEETINEHTESIDLKMDDLLKILLDIYTGNTDDLKRKHDEVAQRISKTNEKMYDEYADRKNDFLDHINDDRQREAASKNEELMDLASGGESTVGGKIFHEGKNPLTKGIANRKVAELVNKVGAANVSKYGIGTSDRLAKITSLKTFGKTAYYITDQKVVEELGKITNEKFKGMYKVLKNITVLKFLWGKAFDISKEDFYWLTDPNNYGYLAGFVRLCKALMERGDTMSNYGSFVAVKKRAYIENNANNHNENTNNESSQDEQVEDHNAEEDVDRATNTNDTPTPTPVPNYGIGTAILSTVGKAAWNGAKTVGEVAWNGAKALGKAVWNGAKALGKAAWNGAKAVGSKAVGKLNDVTGGVLKKAIDAAGKVGSNIFNGIKDTAGKLKKVDKLGPGPNDYGIIKEKSDGSFEPDTSDSKTKEVINRITQNEKEQSDAAKSQIEMHKMLDTDVSQKNPGLLANLISGLLKAALIFPIIKPLYENVIKPLLLPTLEFTYEKILVPAGKWVLNTAIPGIGKLLRDIFNKEVPEYIEADITKDDYDTITDENGNVVFDEDGNAAKALNENGKKKQAKVDLTNSYITEEKTGGINWNERANWYGYPNTVFGMIGSNDIYMDEYKDRANAKIALYQNIGRASKNLTKEEIKETLESSGAVTYNFVGGKDSGNSVSDEALNTIISVYNNKSLSDDEKEIIYRGLAYSNLDDQWRLVNKHFGDLDYINEKDQIKNKYNEYRVSNWSDDFNDVVNDSINVLNGSAGGGNGTKPLSKYGRFKESIYGTGNTNFNTIFDTIKDKIINIGSKITQKQNEFNIGNSINELYSKYISPNDSNSDNINLTYANNLPLQNLDQTEMFTNNNLNSTIDTIERAKAGTISIFSSNYWLDNDGNNIIAKAYNNAMKIMAVPSIIVRDAARIFLSDVNTVISSFTNSKSTLSNNISSLTDSSAAARFSFSAPDNSLSKKLKKDSDTDDDTDNNKSLSGEGKYGRGIYSKQIDPSISKIRFNMNGDSEYQTIGDSGCGPAAAVNVLESMHGRSKNVINAANFAIKGGYKEKNGGTKPKFFNDYFASKGYASQTTSNRNTLASNIKAGIPTVLMGQDKHGVSSSTPYGRNPHYVTATGIDSKGHVIIQDPESRYDNQLYSMNDVMKKTSFGVSAFGRGIMPLRGHTRDQIKGINSPTRFMYKFGRGLKYEKIAKQDLGKFSKLTAADMNKAIKEWNSSSPFNGHGDIFVEASEKTGLDPRYILAHAAWESAWGTSDICQDKGNYFGIGAFDDSAYESAYTFDSTGGSKMRGGIIGGAQWIKENYYDEGQKSLYLMIYGKKQYASAADDWINGISSIMNGCPENTDSSLIGSEYDVSSITSDSSSSSTSNDDENVDPSIFDWLSSVINNSRAGMVFNSLVGSSSKSTSSGNGKYGRSKYGMGEELTPNIWWYLRQAGLTEAGTAGLMGNMEAESSFNLDSVGDGGTSFGLCQWHNDRGTAMKKVAGDNWDTNLSGQLEYLVKELKESYSGVYSTLTSTDDVKEASNKVVTDFEVCAGCNTSAVQNARYNNAKKWYDKFKGTDGTSIDGVSVSSTSDSTSISSSTSNTDNQNPGIFDFLKGVLNNSRVGMVFNSLVGSSSKSTSSGSTSSTSVSTGGSLNTSGNAQAVVENALSQIGYVGDPRGTKHNKYNAWWHSGAYNGEETGITAAKGPAVDWCANFVSWVMRHSGVDESVAPNFSVVDYDLYMKHGAKAVSGKDLLPGDVLFENRGQHTGIVVGYKDGKVYTVEGNGRYDGGDYDGTTVDFKTSQSPNDYYARPAYTTGGSNLNVDQIIKIGQEKENALNASASGGNGIKPLSKYGRFKESLGNSKKRTYKEMHNELNELRKNNYAHTQLMKKESVYGKGTTVNNNIILINTIIKILYTIADNTDKLNTIVSILNDKLGIEISASDINSKTNSATLKQKLMSSITPSMITSTSKLNSYSDDAYSDGVNSIIKIMNLIASE